MKPTNSNENGCDPMSSNCVIWQGPDIDCINLCKGDNISTVVEKLATELCTLLETFNIDNYDTSCFNLAECAPKDFKDLINLLIEKICEDNGITPSPTEAGCPDCEVDICSDFYYSNPQGDVITTMQLKDYVLAIGNKVCTIIGQIGTINITLADYNVRISALEQAAVDPTPTPLPQITPACVLPAIPTDLDVVLSALETQFCSLRTATGDQTDIITALQAACIGLNSADQLNATGTMDQIDGWYNSPSDLSQSFSNLWKTVCDIRGAITFIQNNCCDTGCGAIDLNIAARLNSPTELRLDYSGSIPSNYVDGPVYSSIEITDVGGGGPQVINGVQIKNTYYDPAQPQIITLTGVNGANDVVVKVTYRFVDPVTGSTCQNVVQVVALGTNTCPNLVLVSDYTGVNYSFTWNGTIVTIVTMEIYDATGVVQIATQALSITSTNPNGSFSGLLEGIPYKIRVVINGIPCDFEDFTTLSYPCVAPTLQAPIIDYTNPEGDQNGKTIEGWIVTYNGYPHP